MTVSEIAAALGPFFALVAPSQTLSGEQWEQYAVTLETVSPGDLDDAISSLRKTHAFRNIPLPADVFGRCEDARKKRIAADVAATQMEPEPIQTADGTPHTFTLPGIGSLTLRVLPDDHPALRRYACFDCKDSGWAEGPTTPMGNPSVKRCHCFNNNPVLALERARRAERQRKHA